MTEQSKRTLPTRSPSSARRVSPRLAERIAPRSVDSSPGLRLLPFVLSVIAGCSDVISFVGLGGLFTAHITGNLVVLAAHVLSGEPAQVALILSVPIFIAALALTRVLVGGLELIDSLRSASASAPVPVARRLFCRLRRNRLGRRPGWSKPDFCRHARRLGDGGAERGGPGLADWGPIHSGDDDQRYPLHDGYRRDPAGTRPGRSSQVPSSSKAYLVGHRRVHNWLWPRRRMQVEGRPLVARAADRSRIGGDCDEFCSELRWRRASMTGTPQAVCGKRG